ncbi:hypothetical protein L2719_09515 [Shewanella schlegeliana]|uniref:Uncharacterized protein n=2 Tax=Shewanella TaxID=22 RepID=B0TTG4_SHEHH|nr:MULTISPECIES: hypothetical protein [Shewanella]ABZ78105.1 conserved hypothetical protein [Shewanella halifaxensis HAW-EB4]MBL4912709.1 hypothetical protein [Shewanella schlegeliana]MCK8044377.1 hypothetical protein [Shewanella sp. 1CM18E]MCL1109781.1 hypothetical protein [Shewanella schlegeliana]GIU30326.1 hypothetical protein TUM4433_20670 [Shewanella schlegeliana]
MDNQQDSYMTEETLIETVENQIADGEPKKVKETLMRLVMTGTPREEAIQWMACALAIEVSDVMLNNASFNEKRYNQHLDAMPNLDWMED